jgi:hypothetical protein
MLLDYLVYDMVNYYNNKQLLLLAFEVHIVVVELERVFDLLV